MANLYERKEYFIDRSFQTRFILKFCLVVVIASSAIGALLVLFSQGSTTVAIENTKVLVKRTSDFFLPLVTLTTIVVSIGAAIVVLALTLFVSHKIAGPLFRIKREVDFLKGGNLARNFKIRERDQLQLLAKSLHEMCDALRQKHAELKNKWGVLKNYVDDRNFSVAPDERAKLAKIAEEIEETLDYFKV